MKSSAVYCSTLILLNSIAFAEDISEGEIITVTATRAEQSVNTIAKSIAVIDEIEIERVGPSHVQQLLNRQAGVNFHRNNGQEYLASIRSPVLTGAGACGAFLMLENGIALRPHGFCNVNELFESHNEQAQRIEIVRGPATPYFGSNGLHGVVNIVQPAGFDREDALKVSLGEHEYLSLGLNSSSDSIALSATVQHDGGYRDDSGYTQQKLSLQHKAELEQVELNTYLTVFHLDQQTAGFLTGKDSYKNEALSKTNANPEAYRKASGFRLHQEYQFESGLVVKPYLRATQMEFLQHFLPGQPVEENQHFSLGVQMQQQSKVSDYITINYGFDTEYAKVELLQFQLTPTQGSAFLQATIPTGKHYDYSVDIMTAAPFVQFNAAVNDKLSLIAGARLEYSYFDYSNKMNSGRVDELGNSCGFGGCRYTRPESREDDFLVLSPKIGLIYQIDQQQSAFINVSHGFRTPQATELYRLQRQQTVADLEPENLWGIEVSWRLNSEEVQIESNIYYFNKRNVISRTNDFFNVSDGETSHKGIELSASRRFYEAFQFSINGAYSIHQYENNPNISDQNIIGNDIDTAPRLLANAFLRYYSDDLRAELHAHYTSKYFLDAENEYQYPGHFLVNANMNYRLTDATSVSLHVMNLTDKRYAERADYTSFTDERYFPGEGRNIKLSFKHAF